MEKMNKEKMTRPPYSSTGQSEEVLNIFKRITPKKIDSKFIVENKIATAPNASTVVNFARWIGIINEENIVNQEKANKLKLIGDERNSFIKELIEQSYQEILEAVNLQEAKRDDITNFFIHNYNFGLTQAKSAGILFLHLCTRYGIPLSDELKKKTHFTEGKRERTKNPKKLGEKFSKEKNKVEEELAERDIPIKKGITIEVHSTMGRNNFRASTKQEFKQLRIDLEKIWDAIEIFWKEEPPINSHITETNEEENQTPSDV